MCSLPLWSVTPHYLRSASANTALCRSPLAGNATLDWTLLPVWEALTQIAAKGNEQTALVFSLQLLAVVFDTFNDIEKRKFKSLLLHKRTAIQHAYHLLITKQVQRAAGRLRAACAVAGGEVSLWRKGIWMPAPTRGHGGTSVKWENFVLERMWSLSSSCGWPGDLLAEHQSLEEGM